MESRVTYVRFVIGQRDEHSHVSQGVFQAAITLRESNQLTQYEDDQLHDDLSWLGMHLKTPSVLVYTGTERAICWFHPRAKKPITRVRSVARLLNEHGYYVRMLTTDRPGTVIYEDGWQIVAYPHRDQRSKL
ncbi:MAG: hypothetical protein AAF333_05895 [Planctomycetota bacterium]